MTGSLQIKNGKYYLAISYKNDDGKHKVKWIATGLPVKNNKRRAEQMLRDKLAEYENPSQLEREEIPFHLFIKQWLAYVKPRVRGNTFEAYSVAANAHVIPYYKKSGVSLGELLPIHIEQYYQDKLAEGLSRTTIVKHNTVIHGTLRYAVKKLRILKYNPADSADLPPKEDEPFQGKTYTGEQMKALLQKVKGAPIEPVVVLAAFYGLRRSEILGLQWDAVDWGRNKIHIRRTAVKCGSKTVYDDKVKNRGSKRTLPLKPGMKRYLQKLYAHQRQMQKLCKTGYIQNDYVCKWDNGQPFEPNNVTRQFRLFLEKNNMPAIRLHDLRHSSASLLHSLGFSMKEIAEWLGHGDVKSTNLYTHVEESAKDNMADKLGEVLQF